MERLLKRINEHLFNCGSVYKFRQTHDPASIDKLLSTMPSRVRSKCIIHGSTANGKLITAHDKRSGHLVSYLMFKVHRKPIRFAEILYSCTTIDHRRKGLSHMMRLVCIIYAKINKCIYVVSDANEISGKVLQKLGFHWNAGEDGTGDYIAELGNELQWNASPTAMLSLSDHSVQSLYDQLKKIKCPRVSKSVQP
jgi:hypothetical protein